MLLSALLPFLAVYLRLAVADTSAKKPNVLVIMADDQDMLLESLSVQPNVNALIGAQGVNYTKHYCTVAWCCPSRVNFLTGRAAHNTNVTALSLPYGGWQQFKMQNLNTNYLPVWINASGISTYYAGKFMNSYSTSDYKNPHPAAWTQSSFLVDPYTYEYFNSHWTNGYTDVITGFNGTHTTNVTQTKALAYIDDAAQAGNQFFMMIAPVAPHVQLPNGIRGPPPQPEFANDFEKRVSPRTGNFNPDEPSGSSWVYNLPKQNASTVAAGDQEYVYRLQNLAGIDAMVAALIQRLEDHNLLDNTYIIYTSDNGFHIGNHRLLPGKRCGYEEDINIPMLIRGPDVAKNVTSTLFNSHTDMAPTILQMLGVPLRSDFDGQPLPYTEADFSSSNSSQNEYVNVEFWDSNETDKQADGAIEAPGSYYNNTYKSIRLQSDNYSFYYSVWCDGSHEFYDMKTDFVQMHNLLGPNNQTAGTATYFGRPAAQLFTRLDTLLLVLKECKQESCRNAYSVLFPKGQVTNLSGAMAAQYDKFFSNQPKVSFAKCIGGHITSEEGPQSATPYQG